MRNFIKSAVFVAAVVIATSQTASAREFGEIYTQCGLGAMIAPTNNVVAVVTNITSDLGTTAIISNMSSPDTCKGGKARTAMFIHESYDAIASDLSRGEGKYLTSLAALNGWDLTKQTAMKEELRAGFAALVAALRIDA